MTADQMWQRVENVIHHLLTLGMELNRKRWVQRAQKCLRILLSPNIYGQVLAARTVRPVVQRVFRKPHSDEMEVLALGIPIREAVTLGEVMQLYVCSS